MVKRGKLIVLEGVDGSGKRTQMELLVGALKALGVECTRMSFPKYESFFGKMVARFLNGEFGGLEEVDAHFSALLYAGDRLEARLEMERALGGGRVLLADRYIASNLAHQAARVAEEKRGEFLEWLEELEYRVYGLPAEDLVVYLRVPAEVGHRLVLEKGARAYTRQKQDLLEADVKHLQGAAGVYDELAKRKSWVTVDCWDGKAMRKPEEIHAELLAAVTRCIEIADAKSKSG